MIPLPYLALVAQLINFILLFFKNNERLMIYESLWLELGKIIHKNRRLVNHFFWGIINFLDL